MQAPDGQAAQGALINSWIAAVRSRPSAMCGIFLDDTDGQPHGSRARPWDEPDLLVEAWLDADDLHLRFDRYGAVIDVNISSMRAVESVQHPWGAGIRIEGTIGEEPAQIWLV